MQQGRAESRPELRGRGGRPSRQQSAQLADRILDEIAALRRPRPLVFEVDEGTSQDKILSESVAPASARRRIIVE